MFQISHALAVHVCVQSVRLCPTLCDSMDCSHIQGQSCWLQVPPGSRLPLLILTHWKPQLRKWYWCGHPHFSTVSGGCLGRDMGRCRQQQDSLRPLPRLQFDFCVPSFLLPLSVSYRQKTLEEAAALAIVLSSGDPSSPFSGLFFTSQFSCGLKTLRGPTLASDTDGANSEMIVVYYSPCWVYLLLTSQYIYSFTMNLAEQISFLWTLNIKISLKVFYLKKNCF